MAVQKSIKYHIFFKSATEAIIGMQLLYSIHMEFAHGTQEITFNAKNDFDVAQMYFDKQGIKYEAYESESHKIV